MINEKISELYNQYCETPGGREYYGVIIPCGIVDENTYFSSSPRIVFVLKEPHEEAHTHY